MTTEQPPALGLRSLWSKWVLVLAGSGLSFQLVAWLAPHVSLPAVLAYVIGFAMVVTATIGVALVVPAKPRWSALYVGLSSLAVLLCVRYLGVQGVLASTLVMLALLAAGSVLGSLVGSGIEHAGHLLFVALVSALADVFSVTQPEGLSAAIVKAPAALAVLAVPSPMLGTTHIEPFLGVGDVMFTGLYIAAARVHGLSLGRTVIALALAFAATMSVVIATELPVPALPFLGIAMLLAHPSARMPPVRDRNRGLMVVGAMLVALVVLLLRRRG